MFTQPESNPSFASQEEEILDYWQREGIVAKHLHKNEGVGESYVIYDGPPTANAKPPLHTMVPMSFKDLVGRYKTMRGYYVPRQVGWDTHGLPVEVQVEKALGLSGKKEILSLVPGDERASIEKFNEACRTSVWEYKQEWDKYVPRVGYWTDTEKPYVTYEADYVFGVWKVFKEVWDKGLAYKSYKVIPYCPRCGTALSAAEVAQEYQDVKDVTAFVSFPLADHPGRSFLAWTTTPWTLPGNVALAVGPDIDYVVVRQEAGEFIVAKSRLEAIKYDYTIVEEMKGSALVGLKYLPPFPEVFADMPEPKHSVLAGSFVTTEDGTGIVHIAPMYGEEDFNLAKAAGFPMRHTVGLDGRFTVPVAGLEGVYVRDALGLLLTALTERHALYAKQSHTHSYPHCWRCKTALMYYAKDSWFIAMSAQREQLVASNQAVTWVPEHIKEGRFGDFIREARDWAVSRERFWGTPLPIWASEDGDYICVGSLEELRSYAKDPELAGEGMDPHRPYVDDIVLVKEGKEYQREPLVMDVWFDSGAMPYASGRVAKGEFPADYVAEAVDQTRGWFNSLNNIGTLLAGKAPYKTVVCMGHLVDESGKKMSKSGPNSLKPQEVFDQVGVDAIRWFLYTVNSPGEPKAFSIKEVQMAYRKSLLLVKNMLNYFVTYANLATFEPKGVESVPQEDLSEMDRWVLALEKQTIASVTSDLEKYDFMRASRGIEEYINDLSTWYLRRSRKRDDVAFFETFRHVLLTLSKLLAPFTPFAAESFYQVLKSEGRAESVHLASWPEAAGITKEEDEILLSMRATRELVEEALSLRAEAKVKVRQPLAVLETSLALNDDQRSIVAEELNVLEVRTVEETDPAYLSRNTGKFTLALDVVLTDELTEQGAARDLLRQLQQLRKNQGLQPGQSAVLLAGAYERSVLEPLLTKYAWVAGDAFLTITEDSWTQQGSEEIELNGETLTVSLRA